MGLWVFMGEDLGTVKILICNGKGEANKSLLFIKNHNSSDCQQLPES